MKVQFLVGISGSGKSTYVKKILQNSDEKIAVISRDSIRERYNLFGHKYELEKIVSEVFNKELLLALEIGVDKIIIDNLNLKPKYVREVKKTIEENTNKEIDFSMEVFDVDFKTCVERNSKREIQRMVPTEAMKKQKSLFDMNLKKVEDVLKEPRSKIKDVYDLVEQDKTLRKAYIFDVDGTLALNNGKRKFFEWKYVGLDEPIEEVIQMARILRSNGYSIIVMSGRDSVCMEETKEWLEKYDVPFDEIFMRPEGSNDRDSKIKYDLYNENIKDKFYIEGVFDDRDQVVKMWRSIGFRVYQVNYGNF